jgi:hypothetical protein
MDTTVDAGIVLVRPACLHWQSKFLSSACAASPARCAVRVLVLYKQCATIVHLKGDFDLIVLTSHCAVKRCCENSRLAWMLRSIEASYSIIERPMSSGNISRRYGPLKPPFHSPSYVGRTFVIVASLVSKSAAFALSESAAKGTITVTKRPKIAPPATTQGVYINC